MELKRIIEELEKIKSQINYFIGYVECYNDSHEEKKSKFVVINGNNIKLNK